MIQIKTTVHNKLSEVVNEYSTTPYSAIERLIGDNYSTAVSIKNTIDIHSNKCESLGLAEFIYLVLLLQTKFYLDNSNYDNHDDYEKVIKIHKILDYLFKRETITIEHLKVVSTHCQPLFDALYGTETINLIFSSQVVKIYKYSNELYKRIKIDFPFVESFDFLRLNNIFTFLHYIKSSKVREIINGILLDLEAIKQFLSPKETIEKAPGLRQTFEKMCQEYLNPVHMDILNMNQLEYIEYLESSLRAAEALTPNIQDIKSCFKFKKSNQKGMAKLLYPLLAIVIDNGDFPNHEEWVERMQESGKMDDRKAWTTHVRHKVNKYVKLSELFNQ